MPKFVVTSRNPVKLTAAEQGVHTLLPDQHHTFETVSVPSGVSDQPMSDRETLTGAENRVANGREAAPNADFWVGIEGGIEIRPEGMFAAAWVAIGSSRHPNLIGRGRTSSFQLPPEIAAMVEGGLELGDADDRFFGQTNSKQKMGAVGLLTHNVIDRAGLYVPAVTLALMPFLHPHWYDLSHS